MPLKEEGTTKKSNSKEFLLGGKEFLQQMEEEEVSYVMVCNPKETLIHTRISYLPIEFRELLHEFHDILGDDFLNKLPPKQSISHHIDLI